MLSNAKKSTKLARNTGNLHSNIFSVNHQYAKGAEHYFVIELEMEPSLNNRRHEGQRECERHFTNFNKDEADFAQVSPAPIPLHIRLSSNNPVDIPIVCSQGDWKSSPMAPVPPKTSTIDLVPMVTVNIPAPSPSLHAQGSCDWEVHRPPSVDDAAFALVDLCTLLRSQNTTIRSDDVLRT